MGARAPPAGTELEAWSGHRFKGQYSFADVVAEAAKIEADEGPLTWRCGDAVRAHLGVDAAANYALRRPPLAT